MYAHIRYDVYVPRREKERERGEKKEKMPAADDTSWKRAVVCFPFELCALLACVLCFFLLGFVARLLLWTSDNSWPGGGDAASHEWSDFWHVDAWFLLYASLVIGTLFAIVFVYVMLKRGVVCVGERACYYGVKAPVTAVGRRLRRWWWQRRWRQKDGVNTTMQTVEDSEFIDLLIAHDRARRELEERSKLTDMQEVAFTIE